MVKIGIAMLMVAGIFETLRVCVQFKIRNIDIYEEEYVKAMKVIRPLSILVPVLTWGAFILVALKGCDV